MSAAKQMLKGFVLACYHLLARILPTSRRTVVFMSSLGRSATGNPRAVCERMAELGMTKDFRCYYILDEPKRFADGLPKGVRPLRNARLRYYLVMARAGVWVSDTRFQNYMVKKKDAIYIQTWHGTPLKKLGLDLVALHMAGGETLSEYKEAFQKNAATWDYLISQNPFSTRVFRQAFGFTKTMLEIGYPRNDKLVGWCGKRAGQPEASRSNMVVQERNGKTAQEKNGNAEAAAICARLRRRLGIPDGKKVMLYAPTWRDDAFYNEKDYRFVTALDFEKFAAAFAKEYILVIKYHYMVREHGEKNRFPDFIRTVGEDVDISELYLLSDLLVTDYSSAMFDYSLTGRPMYFFAYDLENYRNSLRGFYFDFEEEAPGPIVTTTKALIAAIQAGVTRKDAERYRRFVEKYNPYDDGCASDQVLAVIKKYREGKN